MSNEDPFGLPLELCCRPLSLIGLAGLDTTKNHTHRFIWDAFNKNPNRLPLQLKLIHPNHQFPASKPKRTSFDRYIPKGILKKNWLKKHLLEIPAVVAVLFDLSWDDPNWEQKKNQCVSLVQAVKSQLGNLGTKIAIILIQKIAPLPAAEDGKAAERAAALCTASDINSKQLYVLPQDDHLPGYIVRLENALHELAKAYYTQEVKLVKNHKDQLNKTTHRYLFVRHNFKMGFFCELKQDDRTARSFYDVAYTHLKEVRISDTNIMEVKLIAGFINYKLCGLMFRLGEPRDALTQLRSHVRLYKHRLGPKELLFEHYAWLAVQYSSFADLFSDAIRQGLSAMQTEHPGFYYRLAAFHANDRKLVAQELCVDAGSPSDIAVTTVEYWGQRAWRPGKLSAEPLDPVAERDGVHALQAAEKKVDHSALIVGYLGSAISHFKTYRCPRMRLQLVVQMAEEYHCARDYGKSLTLLSHILGDYRSEKWYDLLGKLLQLGLSSAFLAANVQDYVTFALEALGPTVKLDANYKLRVFNNFMAILERELPEPEPNELPENVTRAHQLWSAANSLEPLFVDVGSTPICLSVAATFAKAEFAVKEPISVDLRIRSFCPGHVQLGRLTVSLCSDTAACDIFSTQGEISLDGGETIAVTCEGVCQIDPGREIRVAAVSIPFQVQGGRGFVVKLHPRLPLSDDIPEFQNLRVSICKDAWTTFSGKPTAVIESAKAAVSLEIKHEGRALLGELYPVNVSVVNAESTTLFHPVLEVKLIAPGDENSPDQSTRLSDAQQTSISPRNIKLFLDAIPPGATGTTCIYVKGYSVGERLLSLFLTYNPSEDVSTPGKNSSAVEEQIKVPVSKPFEISSEIVTTKFEPASTCYAMETFLLYTSVLITAPCSLTIHHSTLELGLLAVSESKELTSQLAGVTLGPGETGRDIFPIKLTEAKDQPLAVGTYVVQWSREGSSTVTSSSITLPAVRCLPTLLSVDMTLPAHGRVRTPMAVEYRLYNRTANLLQLDMHMDASDAFMFAGQRQALLRLLPETERCLQYKLYPLFSGLVALPRIVLTAPDLTEELNSLLERSLPSHVYVMPQEKVASTGL